MIYSYGYKIFNHPSADLSLYECGFEECIPEYTYGPCERQHYVMHYILSGKGTFCAEGKTYSLGQGDLFLIVPGQTTVYSADKQNPWTYVWVGFNGLKAESYMNAIGLTIQSPVMHYSLKKELKPLFRDMINAPSATPMIQETEQIATFYHILSRLLENAQNTPKKKIPSNQKEIYLRKALSYIDIHYAEDISVAEISDFINIDRTYLFNLFKSLLNMSPQQYLLNYRISKAALMLEHSDLSVAEIASYVGYTDPLAFSKAFKKVKQISPQNYRNKKRKDE